jgi:hypothetical protein
MRSSCYLGSPLRADAADSPAAPLRLANLALDRLAPLGPPASVGLRGLAAVMRSLLAATLAASGLLRMIGELQPT